MFTFIIHHFLYLVQVGYDINSTGHPSKRDQLIVTLNTISIYPSCTQSADQNPIRGTACEGTSEKVLA